MGRVAQLPLLAVAAALTKADEAVASSYFAIEEMVKIRAVKLGLSSFRLTVLNPTKRLSPRKLPSHRIDIDLLSMKAYAIALSRSSGQYRNPMTAVA